MADTGGRNYRTDANGDVHVGAGVVLGDSSSSVPGVIRYNSGNAEVTDGVTWSSLAGASVATALQKTSSLIYTMDEASGNLINSSAFPATVNMDGSLLGGTPPARVADSPVASSPNCLEFVAGSYVNIANPTMLTFDLTRGMHLSFWYKGTENASFMLRSNNGAWDPGSQHFLVATNDVELYMWGGMPSAVTFTHGSLQDGAWHKIEVFINGVFSRVSCNIDGIFRGRYTYTGMAAANPAHTVWVGNAAGTTTFKLADYRYTLM